jgi:hypothetical protein
MLTAIGTPMRTSFTMKYSFFIRKHKRVTLRQVKQTKKRVQHLEYSPIAEIIGWCGSVAFLSGYALLSFGILSSNSVLYHLTLMIGSIGLGIVTYRHRAFQSVVVNVIFTSLAFMAIIRLLFFA